MKAYLVDEGVLLSKSGEEFEKYAVVYNKKYGFYDENQYYELEKQKAINAAKEYVENGIERTYAVVSETVLSDDFDVEYGCVEGENYSLDAVVYSVAKINEEIVEDFLKQ